MAAPPALFSFAGTALGDPIEIGAAVAVLQGGSLPLQLTAAKSQFGHAEPAAGGVGVVQAAALVRSNHVNAIMLLTTINPYVASAFKMLKSSTPPCLPRQEGGAVCGTLSSFSTNMHQVTGISSFAFQGTNGHAILAKENSSSWTHLDTDMSLTVWRKQRYWFAAQQHQLLKSCKSSIKSTICIACSAEDASLSFIQDHQV